MLEHISVSLFYAPAFICINFWRTNEQNIVKNMPSQKMLELVRRKILVMMSWVKKIMPLVMRPLLANRILRFLHTMNALLLCCLYMIWYWVLELEERQILKVEGKTSTFLSFYSMVVVYIDLWFKCFRYLLVTYEARTLENSCVRVGHIRIIHSWTLLDYLNYSIIFYFCFLNFYSYRWKYHNN